MYTAYDIPIPEITPFITVILILLWVAAPALVLHFCHFQDTGENGYWCRQRWQQHGEETRLIRTAQTSDDVMEAALVDDDIVDAW